jgi:tRNA(Ile)-lysidine synthase
MQSCLELIPDDAQRVFVAFSGGLDSTVLLHLLVAETRKFEIIPWHFNHGLLDVASDMEQFCIEQAGRLGLEIRVDQLHLDEVESNVEAVARHKRYLLFAQHTRAGDCILTAHHANDQAETFLLNALRGSGSAGLRGIARQRMLGGGALLLRPLLDFSRSQLETYARQHKLTWVDDPSNQASRFDRNYLRNQVIPALKTRWPHFQNSLATASELQSEIQDLLDEIAALDLLQLNTTASRGIATLDVAQLLLLSPGRRKNLVRYWIADAGLPVISHARMQELMHQIHAKPDAIPEIAMPDYSIRLYDQRLFLVVNDKLRDRSGSFDFGLQANVEIEKFGLRAKRREIFRMLKVSDQNQALSLKFRDEGQQNDDRHRLKRMFQKHRVPPWERAAIAQVYLDGKLEGLLL